MHKKLILIGVALFIVFTNEVYSQKWVVKDSILVFPTNFNSWLKKNNGGVDPLNPGQGNQHGPLGNIGTNQGVDLFDFNKDGLPDLTFQLFPSNNITREYVKGIFLQNTAGKFVLDTNFIIKGKGDMWLGGFGDFNGDGLMDYHYIVSNYHGADTDRIYSPEMINDNWPEKVFMNNGKGFDTLTLDVDNLTVESSYVADIDKDGTDEIIATDRGPDYVIVYKYDKSKKKFYKSNNDLTEAWKQRFNQSVSRYPLFNVANVNNQNEFEVIISDSSNSKEINEPDWQPFNFSKFTYVNYNFNTKKIKTISLNRDSIFIPIKYSKQDADDYYRFSIHEKITAYKMDVDKNGEEEIIVGGFYMNNYYKKNTHRYAYGWKALGLNGKDLTTQFFSDSGFDRNTELFSYGLDIDDNANGIEMIPGSWGNRNVGELGNYYKVVNGKFQKSFIRDIRLITGKKIDSSYFKNTELVKFPNFTKNRNALLLYDFDNLNRASIIFQLDCSELAKPIFSNTNLSFCPGDSLKLSITNINKSDSIKWYFGSNADLTNVVSKTFRDSVKLFVIRTDSIGCSASSDTIQLILNSKPAKPTTIASSVCIGGMANALSATATTGNSLRWYGTNATGGTPSASAPTVSSSVVGVTNYYVSQVSSQGCESDRDLLKHTVNPLPAKPVISWSGVQFSTTATGVNYQWLLNGTSISGATASTHKPLNTGDFKLRITDPNGCVNVSDSFKLVVTAIANLANTPASNIATVYPNPASDKVVLEFAALPTINLNFQLVTPSGKVLSSTTDRNKVNIIDVSDVQSGNYFIRVIGKKYNQVKKVLIQK